MSSITFALMKNVWLITSNFTSYFHGNLPYSKFFLSQDSAQGATGDVTAVTPRKTGNFTINKVIISARCCQKEDASRMKLAGRWPDSV